MKSIGNIIGNMPQQTKPTQSGTIKIKNEGRIKEIFKVLGGIYPQWERSITDQNIRYKMSVWDTYLKHYINSECFDALKLLKGRHTDHPPNPLQFSELCDIVRRNAKPVDTKKLDAPLISKKSREEHFDAFNNLSLEEKLKLVPLSHHKHWIKIHKEQEDGEMP